MGKPPLGLKSDQPEAAPKKRKRIRQVSKKRAAYRASVDGMKGSEYMALAATRPCVACGATHRHRELHHCKDKPPLGQAGPYQKSPHEHVRTGDFDVIPLCMFYCHKDGPDAYHTDRTTWNERHGPDYSYILPTRAAVAAMQGEIDF